MRRRAETSCGDAPGPPSRRRFARPQGARKERRLEHAPASSCAGRSSPGRSGASSSRPSTSPRDRCCRRFTSATIWSSRNGLTASRATACRSASRRSTAASSRICPSAATSSCSAIRPKTPTSSSASSASPATRLQLRGGEVILNGQPCRAQRFAATQMPISAEQPMPGRAAGDAVRQRHWPPA